jgi:predicted acylesterase/phospholipase RssA
VDSPRSDTLPVERILELHAQFSQLEPLRQLERELVRRCAKKKSALESHELEAIRYAIAVAALGPITTRHGDVDAFELVAPFRHWLIEQLSYFIVPGGERAIDWRGLKQLRPSIMTRVDEVRTHVLTHYSRELSLDRFEREVTQKALVLVLGGGGGSGYCHLGALALLADMGLTPSLIVGASMGALIGMFRAERNAYDPVATALALPRPSEWSKVFTPYRGYSRYGFPGTIELKARAVGNDTFQRLIGKPIPRITDLAIPYRAVVTGLRTGIGLALSDIERQIELTTGRRRPQRAQKQLRLFVGTMKTMLDNPRLLEEVVFGGPGLEDFDAIDAMGLSCAVPGIIHYDIFDDANPSAQTLRELLHERRLLRLTDGGVISNVPCRAAWQTVQRGEIGYRNSFVLAFDAFAPVLNRNALFLPVQQLARRSTLVNRPYCDHLITYRRPPAPFHLLLSLERLQRVISDTRSQLKSERPFIDLMMRPLPRWGNLQRAFPEAAL